MRQAPSHLSTAVPNEPFARANNSKGVEQDPMRRMFDSLATGGYGPTGEPHRFRSRCPAHDGDNRDALAITEGADGRVLLRCFRGCEPKQILDALGLKWAALFPVGHRHAEKRKPRPVKSLSPGAAFMDQLTGAGYRWKATVDLDECPYCGAELCWLVVHDAGGVDVNCSDGCHYSDVVRAVETRAAIADAGVDL